MAKKTLYQVHPKHNIFIDGGDEGPMKIFGGEQVELTAAEAKFFLSRGALLPVVVDDEEDTTPDNAA